MDLSPWTKTQYVFPPVEGNVLFFSHGQDAVYAHPGRLSLSPANQQELQIKRDIALTLASYSIGAVAEKAYTNGVIASAGKAYMFAEGLKTKTVHCRAPGV